MAFRHKIRNFLYLLQDYYYKKIIRKPRIYFSKRPLPRPFKISNQKILNPKLNLYTQIRFNNKDFVRLFIETIRSANFYFKKQKLKFLAHPDKL